MKKLQRWLKKRKAAFFRFLIIAMIGLFALAFKIVESPWIILVFVLIATTFLLIGLSYEEVMQSFGLWKEKPPVP